MTRPTDADLDGVQFMTFLAELPPDQLTEAHQDRFEELIRGTSLPDDLLMAHVRVIKRQANERNREAA